MNVAVRRAEESMRKFREQPDMKTSDHWLVDPLHSTWGSDLSRLDLAEALTGVKLPDLKSLDPTSKYAHNFIKELSRTDPGCIIIPGFNKDFNKVLPSKSSVLDHLVAITRAAGTWKIPTYSTLKNLASVRQPTEEEINKIDVRVHSFVHDPTSNINTLSDWIMKKFQKSEEERPIGVVGMAVLAMTCTQDDFIEVTSPDTRDKVVKFKTADHPDVEAAPSRIPVKFVIGDGISWCAIFQHSVHRISTGYYKMVNSGIPKEFLQLLNRIPAFTGQYIKSDVLDMEDWIRASTGESSFRFKAFIEIQSLATLAGYNCVKSDTSVLPFLAAGVTTFRFFEWTEDFWRHDWSSIPFQIRWDILSQLRCYTYEYITFLYALLYEILPDPEVITHLTRMTSLELADWWATYIVFTLNATTPQSQATRTAQQTREDLINTLTKNTSDGARAGEPPYRIKQFACLLGNWPPLTKGGPRYLHPVRNHFLVQYQIFGTLQVPGFENMFKRPLNPFMADYARYGFSQDRIIRLNTNAPVPSQTTSLHLECHPMIKPQTANILVSDISFQVLHDEAARVRRPVRDILLEWVRFNVNRVRHLFELVERDQDLADLIYPHYEKIRLIYMNIGTSNPFDVRSLEERLAASRTRETQDIKDKLAKVNETLADLKEAKFNLELAVDLLEDDEYRGHKSDRTEYRDYSMAVPSLRHIRKKRFRPIRPQQIIPPLHERIAARQVKIPAPSLPMGDPTWIDEAEFAPIISDTYLASSRARGRSTNRTDLYTFKRSCPQNVRQRSRSAPRKRRRQQSRSKSRSQSRPRSQPSKFEQENQVTSEADEGRNSGKAGNTTPSPAESPSGFPRSPSIAIDYPSPPHKMEENEQEDNDHDDIHILSETLANTSVDRSN